MQKWLNILLAILSLASLAGCSTNQQAAELVNSVAHNLNLLSFTQGNVTAGSGGGSSPTVGNSVQSGECYHQLGGGTVSVAGTAFNSFAVFTLNLSLSLPGTGNHFTCNVQLQYKLDSSGSYPLGPGLVTSCEGFNCSINGQSISCTDLQDALQKYTCSATGNF